MIRPEEFKRRREELLENFSEELAERSYESIEMKVNNSFYEYAENGRILIGDDHFDRPFEEILKKYGVSVEKNPKLIDEISERANKKLEEFIKQNGWKLECNANGNNYIQPLATESED